MTPITLDFETHPIEPGSPKSPRPVGLAIRWPNGARKYYAWGHPLQNNSSFKEVKALIKGRMKRVPLLFHNAQFDVRILMEWFSFKPRVIHDTKVLAFLLYPTHKTLSLKPLAAEFLGIEPEEQDVMHEWLRSNYLPARRTPNPTKYTAYAPGELAGAYAVGDVERTAALFRKFMPEVEKGGMLEAYERETAIIPLVIQMEQRGIRVDAERLSDDLSEIESRQTKAYRRVLRKLGDVNLKSRQQLAQALDERKLMKRWMTTTKGSRAVGIPALRLTCKDQKLVDDLELISKINKLTGTYMRPWLESAGRNNGYFYPYFNPTRVDAESGGTRTGRFSSNFQQVPKERFGDLPYMRDYVLPDDGHLLVGRDYSQQELRIFAHFGEGTVEQKYNENPRMDFHEVVQAIIADVTGQQLARKTVKICNFLTLYGGGVTRLADQLDIDEDEARSIRFAHRKALPEIEDLVYQLQYFHHKDGHIRTWGGRKYTVEKGKEYKLLNILIQGSAADQTKEAMLRLRLPRGARLMLQVHDELLVSAPREIADKASEKLRQAMEFTERWHVPMLTDASIGERWGDL